MSLHSIRSRYARACRYSWRRPNVVRSPDTITTSGSRSFTSMIARSIRFGTKYGEPQCRPEMCAIVNGRGTGAILLAPLQRLYRGRGKGPQLCVEHGVVLVRVLAGAAIELEVASRLERLVSLLA